MIKKASVLFIFLLFIPYGNTASGQDLRLPYKGQICSDDVAFSIFSLCKGPAGYFSIEDAKNLTSTFKADTKGLGTAAYFTIKNEANKSSAIMAITNGLGPAAQFLTSNVNTFGDTLLSETQGRGSSAGHFVTSSNKNIFVTLRSETYGRGPAGQFAVFNPDSDANALISSTAGIGRAGIFTCYNRDNWSPAFQAWTSGKGAAGYFQIENPNNIFPAVYGTSSGLGNGVLGSSTGSSAAVRGYADGEGSSIYGYKIGNGNAGTFINGDVNNESPALRVENRGELGTAAIFENSAAAWTDRPTIAAINRAGGPGPAVAGLFFGWVVVRGNLRADNADFWNLDVYGTLTKYSGSFKIDHPLDPENKYLYHSFVESPDMKNVYDGVVALDKAGEAWVNLPDYFEALNRDFRYQLTPIGGPAPDLHIAEKISNNKFKIAGGTPGLEVSWQVTGIRQDAYAKAHPIIPEVEKEKENRGKYLTPAEFGKPDELGIHPKKRDQEYVNKILTQLEKQKETDKKDIDNLSKALKLLKEQGKVSDAVHK